MTSIPKERLDLLNDGSIMATPAEVAFILSVTKATIYKWAREKKIPAVREGEIVRFHMPTVVGKKTTKV